MDSQGKELLTQLGPGTCGLATCATCHVCGREPFASQLPPPPDDESAMRECTAAQRRPGSRLGCQVTLTEALGGLAVGLPASRH